jgi:hypothetical protein
LDPAEEIEASGVEVRLDRRSVLKKKVHIQKLPLMSIV